MIKATISLINIKCLLSLSIDIFNELDDDYCDKRVVANKERAQTNLLNKITLNKDYQLEILNTIQKHLFNYEDLTYRPICSELRSLGYEVLSQIKDS